MAGENAVKNLSYVLELLKQTKPTSSGDNTEPFSRDLYVIFAELAFKYGLHGASTDVLKIFFAR